MPILNETHDPSRRSWVESANDSATDFPMQNLPFGVFRREATDEQPRIGVAIGDQVLDIKAGVENRLLTGISPEAACSLCAMTLNQFMALGRTQWSAVRRAVAHLLDEKRTPESGRATPQAALVPQADVEMLLPAAIGDYTDFYASIYHATNVGSMFRPDNPLLPNYKHLPVGYHGRASSIVVSGTPIRRPMGQTVTSDAGPPSFGASRLLDYELELGFFVGPGNPLGQRISMREARDHIFGMVIVNDWSARDVQKWEYQPLGPFNAKNFGTSISPWVVTMEALEPFRISGPPRAKDDPTLLEYLQPADDGVYSISVEAWLSSSGMRVAGQQAMAISRGSFTDMYWTIAQMLAHHTSTGCNLRTGDLLASGTISGPTEDSRGCLLERTWRGQKPLRLPDGTTRKFLEDGDEVYLSACCEGGSARRIGFGSCTGVVLPAK